MTLISFKRFASNIATISAMLWPVKRCCGLYPGNPPLIDDPTPFTGGSKDPFGPILSCLF